MKKIRMFLCAYFPEWSIAVTKRKLRSKNTAHNPHAVLLTKTEAHHVVVARCCSRAASAGVRPTMSLPLAEALAPGAYVELFDPLRDFRALHTLAVWCLRFSPLVGLDAALVTAYSRGDLSSASHLHNGITIDLTGTGAIHGDFSHLCHRLDSMFRHEARIAVAPTIGGAWALSRYGTTSPVVAQSLPALNDLITDLPTIALRIDPSCSALLTDIGVHTIGDLRSLPRHTLAQRFGKLLVYRLNQTFGNLEERLHTVETPHRYERNKIFEPPLTHRRAITYAIEYLFRDLITTLHRHSLAARHFVLTITDTSAHIFRKDFPLASATDDSRHLLSIIQPIIDSMQFCGEVRELSLSALHTGRITSMQRSFTSTTQDASDIERSHNELLNALSVRIGKDCILHAQMHHSYVPERSFSYTSALNHTATPSPSLHEPVAPYTLRERPPILFQTPESIRTIAMLPDKPPSFIQWRKSYLTIRTGFGPERVAPEWWHGSLMDNAFSERDYFTVQDERGRWLWVFRDHHTHEWFIHGVWT